jgi:hypothetical protein
MGLFDRFRNIEHERELPQSRPEPKDGGFSLPDESNLINKLTRMLLRNDRALIVPLINMHLKKRIQEVCNNFSSLNRDQSITINDMQYILAPLSKGELALLGACFWDLLGDPASDELFLMLERLGSYLIGLRAIKVSLNFPPFLGFVPGNGLRMGILDPLVFVTDYEYELNNIGLVVTHVKVNDGGCQKLVPIRTILAIPGRKFGMTSNAKSAHFAPGGIVFGDGRAMENTEWIKRFTRMELY